VFVSVGSLGDYGGFRRRGLIIASTIGSLACCCYTFVPISASLYWLGGLLIVVGSRGFHSFTSSGSIERTSRVHRGSIEGPLRVH
jgi:MFS-type transporter involved in bile tolerance (Atg22 family)